MDVKIYLALAGALGIAYTTYTLLSKPRTITIPRDITKRICQEIKHQMMIVCITYSKAMKKIRDDNIEKLKGRADQIFNNFRNQLSQVYVAKQNLILKKYAVSRQTYGKSLEKWRNDKQIINNTSQILDMMQRSINGLTPDFTIPQQASKSFTREDLCKIYKEMVTLIGKKVTHKLQIEMNTNPNFNPNSDDDFRNAIRQLSIYDVKVDFLKQKGFRDAWGCPNEIFFKYLQSEKTKDQAYEKKVVLYEKCYQKIIELVSADPRGMSDSKIEEMFESALKQSIPVVTTSKKPIQPAAIEKVIQPAPVVQTAPVKSVRQQPKKSAVDQQAELEALMMQQLLSRSQQQPRQEPLEESTKIGLTSSQIQQDWQKHGSINEKPLTKIQEATQQILIGTKDQNLIKSQQQIFSEAIKSVQQTDEAKPVEQQASQQVQQQQLQQQQQKQDEITDLLQQNQEFESNIEKEEPVVEDRVEELEQNPVEQTTVVHSQPAVLEEKSQPAVLEEKFVQDAVLKNEDQEQKNENEDEEDDE